MLMFNWGVLEVMLGSSTFFIVLAKGESSHTGLYDVPMQGSLFGFEMGMILSSFQIFGMLLLVSAKFKRSVRY